MFVTELFMATTCLKHYLRSKVLQKLNKGFYKHVSQYFGRLIAKRLFVKKMLKNIAEIIEIRNRCD